MLSWDAGSRSGEVVTDAGISLPMAPGALDGSGLRHLRPGQRVTCALATAPSAGSVVHTVRINGIEA